ncbi:Penicillinase repressor (plasmid) [Gemmatirosa kalamazoonensis]|uniref:Penicillinase repressor n=1 Tax=Gemmatirosa kalamazoonensis TaxID=861299 RepID=W0RSX1_9BACT|nr:BlaI/MecI/CopY family transcriptional regulator [Gemmatirosa kalamazoonensis]AHG93572.1 Penicillinase repressor [Gemmatirosa kalamazoonensis]
MSAAPPRRGELAELTDLHLLILGALWAGGEATIADVHAAVRHRADVAPKTIATLLGRLEQRGFVTHRLNGRQGVYHALVRRRDVLAARVEGMLASLFAAEDGRSGAVRARTDVRPVDATRLRELLRRAERGLDESDGA